MMWTGMNVESDRGEHYAVGREEREWIASSEWDFVAPNSSLAPRFSIEKGPNGTPKALIAEGNSRSECIGYSRCRVVKGRRLVPIGREDSVSDLNPVESRTVHGLYERFLWRCALTRCGW